MLTMVRNFTYNIVYMRSRKNMLEMKIIPFSIYNKKVIYHFLIKSNFEQDMMKNMKKIDEKIHQFFEKSPIILFL